MRAVWKFLLKVSIVLLKFVFFGINSVAGFFGAMMLSFMTLFITLVQALMITIITLGGIGLIVADRLGFMPGMTFQGITWCIFVLLLAWILSHNPPRAREMWESFYWFDFEDAKECFQGAVQFGRVAIGLSPIPNQQ